MESVSFDTLTFDHPAAAKPARVIGTLHLPMQADRPFACMVMLTSSAGVQRHREHYYAQALNDAGIAALIVDSFTGRGVRRTVADQTLVSGAQMEGDAFAALALLRSDPRIDPQRIGVMGVSKGGGRHAQRRDRRAPALAPRLRPPVRPACRDLPRRHRPAPRPDHARPADLSSCWPAATTTPLPRSPSTMPSACARPATGRIKVKVYSGAHHGWESIGPVFDIRDAENWSCCRNFIEDDGSHFVVAAGRAMPEPEYQAWARIHCVTRGARAGGGTAELKRARHGRPAGLPRGARFRRGKTATGRRDSRSVISSRRESRPRASNSAREAGGIDRRLRGAPRSLASEPLLPGPMSSSGPARARRRSCKAIRAAGDHGLDPDWYGVGAIDKAWPPIRQRAGAEPMRSSPPMPATSRPAGCNANRSTRTSTSSSAGSRAPTC